ncbi:YdcF family protein [Shimazuella sp. AN120528]|uniref:YdcF family protein n=1 Tax=Shimazuella soli TaxID=1892854 RepID=UPI001F10E6DB|nr:YdcF family protein [Shimazuella soli]MCH5583408.1 YdcF family protein [Shimazuella soli]
MIKSLWILLGCLLLLCLFITYQYIKVSYYDNQYPDNKKRDAAIVLGASLWHNKPSPALRERLNTALKLYRTGKIDYFILSGGLGDDEQQSEANAMRTYLLEHHVPIDKMILEDKSHNTKENLQNTKAILMGIPIHSLYLVTHDYHMYRALIYARQADLEVSPAPAHSTVLFGPYHKLRECIALWKLYLFH